MSKCKEINNALELQALDAVKTLISWAGDDPTRPGLQQTPERVLKFFSHFFEGYNIDVSEFEKSIANDIDFDDFILVKDLNIQSFCEHHMLPSEGLAHIAYIPNKKVAGLGTISRIADKCARRLTTQEEITNNIHDIIVSAFDPLGIAIMITLEHRCMTYNQPQTINSQAITTKYSGTFTESAELQNNFLSLVNNRNEAK